MNSENVSVTVTEKESTMAVSQFFSFIDDHKISILLFFACLAICLLFVHWFAWIFSLGRFRSRRDRFDLGVALGQLFLKVINDFRHLLALVMVTIFGLAIAYGLIAAGFDCSKMSTSLQAVVSSLGGLVGTIVGYYFGESSARRATAAEERGVRRLAVEEAFQSVEGEEVNKAPTAPKKDRPDDKAQG